MKDLTVEEPILVRMLGLGNVIVHSSDRSHPVLVLQGVKDCTMLRNQVRGLVVLAERNRRDVEEVSAELLEGLALEYVGRIDEALEQTLVAS